MALSPGDPAPDFSLPDAEGKTYSLADLKGQRVVLYFYPRDNTPGCTKEACGFRDDLSAFTGKNSVIIGVSPDDSKSHKKFVDKYNLPFTLLADPDKKICEAYGVWQEKSMYGRKSMGVVRSTFVIGPDGKIAKAFSNVKVDGHVAKVLDSIG